MTPSRRRFWLISVSVTAHLGLFAGIFATGVWRLDRLEADRRSIDLAVMSPPAPSGGPPSLPIPKFEHKPHLTVVKEPVQPTPVVKVAVAAPESPATPEGGDGNDKGSGTNPNGNPEDTGTCAIPPCGDKPALPKPEPPPHIDPPPVQTATLLPTMLKALRYAGTTDIVPSDNTKMQMMRDDHTKSLAAFKICLSDTGSIESINLVKGTGYGDYDRKLADGIRGWQYHPYQVSGRGVPACGMVSFIYNIK